MFSNHKFKDQLAVINTLTQPGLMKLYRITYDCLARN